MLWNRPLGSQIQMTLAIYVFSSSEWWMAGWMVLRRVAIAFAVHASQPSKVTLHSSGENGSGIDFYEEVPDEDGNPWRLAVKRMPWDVINANAGTLLEVRACSS